MLTMNCPACRYKMEIDEGFRGGICRCSECGAMVTVPDDLQPGAEHFLEKRAEESGRMRSHRSPQTPSAPSTSVRRTSSNLRPAARQSSGSPMAIVMIIAGAAAIAIILIVVLATQRPTAPQANVSDHPVQNHTTPRPAPIAAPASFTLDEYRRAVPEADDKFLIIQMNRGSSLQKAREEWAYQQRQRSN